MAFIKKTYLLLFLLTLILFGCNSNEAIVNPLFTLVSSDISHINFNNLITESDSVNVFANEYMYNGSGVGIGDFNNDGLSDVFFCGSMVSSKLYLNKGNLVFEDVTQRAGLQTSKWCTGVTVVDINNDGFSDLYVCTSHSANQEKRKNLLFINDGKLHFTEQAAAYGLADTGFSTQAAFLDYDQDGDLDMYLLNHRLYSHTANNIQMIDTTGNSPAEDKLFQNDGIPVGDFHPVFHDVTKEAGIVEDGYGLGLAVTDVNNDSWPDIYVANDYIGNDLLWLNNKNGTFSNVIASSLRHQSYNSMGVDAADMNNDGLIDLAVVDMLPEYNTRKKMMVNGTSQEKYEMQLRFGYQPSYVRNMLQLNNGNRKWNNRTEPFYSEIGQMAGVFETDWSWSVLMADFDNDGWKDIHITNGLGKDVTNNDYTSFRNSKVQNNNYVFGGNNLGDENAKDNRTMESLRKNIDQYGSIKMDNYFFHNNGNLSFTNFTYQSGLAIPSISNGAVYADLDNDGDLDLVVNNMNQQAFVWRNEIRKAATDSGHNFLAVSFNGPSNNISGIGSRVTVFAKQGKQYAEQFPVRGFESSVDQRLYFGIGNATVVDSLLIEWADNKIQVLKNLHVNQFLNVNYADAKVYNRTNYSQPLQTPFTEISSQYGMDFKHAETQNYDFNFHQPLLQKYSQLGPCIAKGDINGDGLEDFFVGGASNQSGKLFFQKSDGSFYSGNLLEGNKPSEDLGAELFDADGDRDLDLLITGGSFEFGIPKYNQPRLYKNDGKGFFNLDETALPEITNITQAISIVDFDGDGDKDIFIGGRFLPNKYPQSPRSYLLLNDRGKFRDATKGICAGLEYPGMITGAIFTDFNNDKKPDLVICGEWTSVRFFKNVTNKLLEVTDSTGLTHMNGWWRTIQQADMDNDGDMDYIVGNMGLNNRFHIAVDKPLFLYSKDMDGNGFEELIPSYYIRGPKDTYELFPGLDRNQMAEQIPLIKKKYLLHADYAKINMEQLKRDYGKEGWGILHCDKMLSVWLENKGKGEFKEHPLPSMAQISPVNCVIAKDIDHDGKVDLVIAGNEYQATSGIGRYDASYGLFMKGDGKGEFKVVSAEKSGLILDGDIKNMQLIENAHNDQLLLAVPNDSKLKSFIIQKALKK